MLRLTGLSALLLVSLAGCVTPGSQASIKGRDSLSSAAVCCTHLKTSRIKPLPRAKTTVELNATSQAFVFEEGKAYFEVFELPAFKDTYSITITALPTGTVTDLAVLMPRVTFYSGDFRRTRHFDEQDVKQRGQALERTVFINPSNREDKYLVVSGSSVAVKRELTTNLVRTTPIIAGPFIFHYTSASEAKQEVHNSPTGTFELQAKDLEL